MNANPHSEDELCPSCGEFVLHLELDTGWCSECSGITESRCESCGRSYTKDAPHRRLCQYCRRERWLERNGELMEELIERMPAEAAMRQIYAMNRPFCFSCGNQIKGGKPGISMFCQANVACRKWQRRYRTLKDKFTRKGLQNPKKQALATVAAEIYIKERVSNG